MLAVLVVHTKRSSLFVKKNVKLEYMVGAVVQ